MQSRDVDCCVGFSAHIQAIMDYGMYSREEELLRERKRIGTIGIASYDYHRESGTFLFQAGSGIYHVKDGGPHGFTVSLLIPPPVSLQDFFVLAWIESKRA